MNDGVAPAARPRDDGTVLNVTVLFCRTSEPVYNPRLAPNGFSEVISSIILIASDESGVLRQRLDVLDGLLDDAPTETAKCGATHQGFRLATGQTDIEDGQPDFAWPPSHQFPEIMHESLVIIVLWA